MHGKCPPGKQPLSCSLADFTQKDVRHPFEVIYVPQDDPSSREASADLWQPVKADHMQYIPPSDKQPPAFPPPNFTWNDLEHPFEVIYTPRDDPSSNEASADCRQPAEADYMH